MTTFGEGINNFSTKMAMKKLEYDGTGIVHPFFDLEGTVLNRPSDQLHHFINKLEYAPLATIQEIVQEWNNTVSVYLSIMNNQQIMLINYIRGNYYLSMKKAMQAASNETLENVCKALKRVEAKNKNRGYKSEFCWETGRSYELIHDELISNLQKQDNPEELARVKKEEVQRKQHNNQQLKKGLSHDQINF